MLLPHISFYIFKAIILQTIEVLDFEIFKNLKVERSLVPMCLSVRFKTKNKKGKTKKKKKRRSITMPEMAWPIREAAVGESVLHLALSEVYPKKSSNGRQRPMGHGSQIQRKEE
jgi:hypothetical protein